MNRQKVLLAALLVMLALSIGYSIFKTPRQESVAQLRYKQGTVAPAPRAAEKASPSDDTRVHLDLLEKSGPRFTGYRRNIFRPLFQEEQKPIPVPRMPATAKPVPPPPPPPPPPEPTQLQRDLANFTFLGFLKKDQRKTIFLAKERDIFLVRKGDRIAGKYETVNITDEALTIRQIDGSGDIIIPLVENNPLNAPR